VDPTRPAKDSDGTGDGTEQLGYEQARDELAEVVRALEVGGLSLDDSLALWSAGSGWPGGASSSWPAPGTGWTPCCAQTNHPTRTTKPHRLDTAPPAQHSPHRLDTAA